MVGLASSLAGVGVVRLCVRAGSGRGWGAGFLGVSGGGLVGGGAGGAGGGGRRGGLLVRGCAVWVSGLVFLVRLSVG